MPSCPLPQEARGGTAAASPHLTPPRCCGRERSPRSPPFPPPPSSPHPGEGRYNLWLQLYTSEKKSLQNVPHRKKKKNPKPSEKNLRVGLADGIIKASPEPRLALPLRQPPGEEPRPARPAPSPMDLRAGRSQASEAPAPAPAREPPDPVPVLPPGSLEPGPGRGAWRCPRLRGSGRGGGARAGRPREGPSGDAAFLESARRGQEVAGARRAARATRRPGRRPPGARRGGVPGPRRTEPRAKVGRATTPLCAPDALPRLPPPRGRVPASSCARPGPPLWGDSWGMLACLCTVLWQLPAVPALNRTGDPGPGPSIQKTYDLTRYLEHQLRSLAGTYLNYLGPPFNEPDFNPPRLGVETLPKATVNLEVWRSLNDKLRLTQNYEAYSHLLCYLRGLNRQAATAELRRSLAHFCTSLQGLLGSIAGVMAALGYPLPQPLPGTEPTWAPGPAHSDFLQKMDDFWLLKELQTWLWRSAKDFNRLKKKMQPPATAVTLHLEARGF
uniref:Uncharacterized protein n=1 Tax=Ovis aries TaxID=9940 RepID=A0AC11DXY7_SHEEP